MSRITPVDWRTLVHVFEKFGCEVVRQKGSHIILRCPGAKRPIVIPRYDEIPVFVIKTNLRTAGMTREQYLALLEEVR